MPYTKSEGQGLYRVAQVLESFGSPHKRLKYIHVGGTNGKGSVSFITAAVFKRAGYKTGLFISPHLERYNERISINGENINGADLQRLDSKLRSRIEELQKDGLGELTEFEFTTLLALLYFAERGCQLVVLEVGLGGRLDATNVIPPPVATGITRIDYDHMAQLGEDLRQIAHEKCGIIKKGTRAIVYPEQEPEAMEVIIKTCDERQVPLIIPDLSLLELKSYGEQGSLFRYSGLDIELKLMGRHQILNAATAIELCLAAGSGGFEISRGDIELGIKDLILPARLELIDGSQRVLIDCAHNINGFKALAAIVDEFFSDKGITAVIGMMRDKEYKSCVEMIAPRSQRLISCQVDKPRAAPAGELAGIAQGLCREVLTGTDPLSALKLARSLAAEDDLIIVCGSFYVAGEIRKYLVKP